MDWQSVIDAVVPVILTFLATTGVVLIRKAVKVNELEKNTLMIVGTAKLAYWIIEQISRKTENTIDDKLAAALKIVADELGRDLTGSEISTAATAIKAEHEKVKKLEMIKLGQVF